MGFIHVRKEKPRGSRLSPCRERSGYVSPRKKKKERKKTEEKKPQQLVNNSATAQ